ncbi:MAG: hypothetical protein AAF202_09195, partial [Pseudomonadota bacterium]
MSSVTPISVLAADNTAKRSCALEISSVVDTPLKEAADLRAWIKIWDQELNDRYSGKTTRKSIPRSWRISRRDRRATEGYFHRTGDTIIQSLQDVQGQVNNDLNEITARSLLGKIQGDIRKHHFADKLTLAVKGREFERFKRKTNEAIDNSGAAQIPFAKMQQFLAEYQAHVSGLKEKYGEDLFPREVFLKAGFDVFAMFMLSEILEVPIPSKDSVYALALLHPITDSALDSGINVGPTMQKITAQLKGEKVEAESTYESAVFGLIDQILSDFPSSQNPMAQTLLQDLHAEQLDSVRIQKDGSEEELVHNTLRKGALTYLLFAHLGLGELTIGQAKYFYAGGAILQLIDDMLDMKDDLSEEQNTVWTLSFKKNKRVREPFLKTMGLRKSLEQEADELLGITDNKRKIISSFDFSIRLFFLAAMTDPFVGPALARDARSIAPMSSEGMSELSTTLLDVMALKPGAEQTLLEVFDMGFSNGRYYSSLNGGRELSADQKLNLAKNKPGWWLTL